VIGPTRRQFVRGGLALTVAGLVSSCGVLPSGIWSTAVPRLGHLSIGLQTAAPEWIDAFRGELRRTGYVEGESISIEYRWADTRTERLPALAEELVRQKVDLIVAAGTPAVQAAQRATRTIPIVMALAGDPVGLGIVASLARPGGNVTRLTTLAPELAAKRLQLLKESAPTISRIGVLHNPDDPGRVLVVRETEHAARDLGLDVRPLELREIGAIEQPLAAAIAEGVDALVVLQSGAVTIASVIPVVARYRLPAMYDGGNYVSAGALMFYGPDLTDLYRRAAGYVDRILKGAKPADLPIERPSRFDFLVNLKTAQALGLTIPPSVLQQATEVIQ